MLVVFHRKVVAHRGDVKVHPDFDLCHMSLCVAVEHILKACASGRLSDAQTAPDTPPQHAFDRAAMICFAGCGQ